MVFNGDEIVEGVFSRAEGRWGRRRTKSVGVAIALPIDPVVIPRGKEETSGEGRGENESLQLEHVKKRRRAAIVI